MSDEEFKGFGKIARLSREIVITEKIDGTNAQVYITEDGRMLIGSRTRWITPEDDNFGFAAWAYEHRDELMHLGHGRHFGEWWGKGINRGYGVPDRRFSLFNVGKWHHPDCNPPDCCGVVPILYRGAFSTDAIDAVARSLAERGSVAAPGFGDPEGLMVYHVAANTYFKKTLKGDDMPKSAAGK